MLGTDSSVDVATKENLENLSQIGERLLKKPVTQVNLETGDLVVPIENWETNEDALRRYMIKSHYMFITINTSFNDYAYYYSVYISFFSHIFGIKMLAIILAGLQKCFHKKGGSEN